MTNKNCPKQLSIVLAILLISLFSNSTKAQGPNAPEAASFEPVDATDMVNLVTGDLSYVLPLLNVPSPEGGYPIALSYHAGIAMEQEASWVGLGWSLNPGTINRGVNGYPDDWGKTNINEFFYDVGWTDNYYDFSAGVTLAGGVSVGLGLSWGSNQSLGGYVSASIGLGRKNEASIGASIGTNGASIFGGVYGFDASFGASGVGIGYGTKGDISLGVSLNYSYGSGFSAGASVSTRGLGYNNSRLGVNLSSSGASFNAKANGFGSGISTSNNGITGGDYDFSVSSSGFFIPAYIFYVGYNHTKVKYSLYKYNNLYTSGILNPIVANELKPYSNSTNPSRLLYENNFMDVNVLRKYDNSMDVDRLLDNLDQVDKNNLVLPNYDNYSVTAQGLSGSLKPYIHSELNLSGRGRGEQNTDNLYAAYLNHTVAEYNSSPSSGINVNRDAVKKVNFTFDNIYNSFLRMERSDIYTNAQLFSVHSDYIMNGVVTNETFSFNNFNSLTNAYEAKKREGNYIETFTNKEIRDSYSGGSVSNISNFIDAKQLDSQNTEINLDRLDTDVFLDDGIGAYQITTSDGRTYHYSLPVYNFESFYKNFKNENDEDENFFEMQKTTPYATHWLLTAITGPDYIDINSNGTVDESDYGYWVAFDYGKWSDGYVWQTPNGHLKVDEDDEGDKTYSYAWGRKQIYYLDAIKTRTHTALFIKDLRDDNLSSTKPNAWNQKWTSGDFDFNVHSIKFNSNKPSLVGYEGDILYTSTGQTHSLFEGVNTFIPKHVAAEKTGIAKYIDIPTNKSLKLKKILLLKNENINNIKNRGTVITIIQGQIISNNFYENLRYYTTAERSGDYPINTLYSKPLSISTFNIHQHQNVLDINDIEGLNLESTAQQIINLEHDYSLAKETPNSIATGGHGRLTLKSVQYLGKEGIGLVPPYKFNYHYSGTDYDYDLIDEWGYHKDHPEVWSLREIKTPTGGSINIDYDADSYYAEAASYETKYFEDISLSAAPIPGITIGISLNNVSNTTDYFKTGRNVTLSFTRKTMVNTGPSGIQALHPKEFTTVLRVSSITGNVLHLLTIAETEGITFNDVADMCGNSGTYCYSNLKLKNNQHPLYTNTNSNGKEGGGIRTKRITINNGVKNIAKSEYIYTDPSTSKISGITSYVPSDDPKGIPYVSELPPPMVTYEYVKMVNKDGSGAFLGSTSYKFGVLEPFHEEPGFIYSLGEAFKVKENQSTTFQSGSIIANKYTIHNCLGSVGRMLSIKSHNSNEQLLNESVNNYKTGLDTDGEIGVTQESHKSYKRILKDGVESFAVSSTSKINYPSVLESTATTQGGFTAITYFDKHDFLTGQVLETRTTDSKGNELKRELIPAYSISDYSGLEDLDNNNEPDGYGMGSKVDDNTNKNMLRQEAMTKTYLKVGTEWKETGVGITTWNNDWTYTDYKGDPNHETAISKKIWRKHKSFVWDGDLNPDGTLNGFTNNDPNQDDENFVWTVGPDIHQTNSEWKNISTTTQYDHYSMPLEVQDINENYASTKTCDAESKVMAVCNAAYTEMYYSGAEYFADTAETYFDGQVKAFGHIEVPKEDAHTGTHIVRIGANQNAFEVKLPQNNNRTGSKGEFKISVWAKKGAHTNAKIKVGTSQVSFKASEEVIAGEWVMLNGYITIPSAETLVAITSSSGSIDLDDFRLHPVASSMTSYVYDEWDELTFLIGTNNLATCYVYDAAGRLKETWVEVEDFNGADSGGFIRVSENDYSYKLTE